MNRHFPPGKTILIWLVAFLFNVSRTFGQTSQSVPQMLDRVLPAVVTVAIYQVQGAKRAFGYASDAASAAYERALDLAGVAGSGSGFVIERGGKQYVVTNAHVVEQATSDANIAVFSINQTKYAVKVVGGDSFYDVAVLEITGNQPRQELRALSFKQNDPRIGEAVYAVGNPLGKFPYSVTDGIIGGKNRVQEGLTGKFGYLQSTATIIWGNSGGPLVDSDGNVAGINTKISIKEMGDKVFIQPQINFALEARIAQRIVNDILTNNGRVRRSFYGVEISQRYQTKGEGESREVSAQSLPVLSSVIPSSPAAAALAGKEGASIVKINGIATRNAQEALGALEEIRPGETVTFELEHSGQHERASFKTGELTPTSLATLAKFFLNRHAGVDVAEGNGEIVVKRGSQPEEEQRTDRINSRQDYYRFEKESKRYNKMRGGDASLTVVAAGLVVDENSAEVWRVRNLTDLGIAIRLAALSGVVDLIPETNNGSDAQRIILSGQENVVAETVVY